MAVKNNLCQTERQFAFSKIGFCAGSAKSKILGWLKTFGPAQNILGPLKGQGISCLVGLLSFYFGGSQLVFDGALNAVNSLGWLKN